MRNKNPLSAPKNSASGNDVLCQWKIAHLIKLVVVAAPAELLTRAPTSRALVMVIASAESLVVMGFKDQISLTVRDTNITVYEPKYRRSRCIVHI